MKNKTIILTGGGTAGHIMPNLALLPKLEKYFDKIYYLGEKNGMEAQILKDYKNVEFVDIPATKLIRKLTLKNLTVPFKLLCSINKTKKIIKEINPSVIFCKGGFVSVPVAIAGKKNKVPVISHESDLTMGLANKIILHYCDVMCLSFESTSNNKKCVFTGSPIRNQVLNGQKENILKSFNGFNPNLKTVLFFGGSLGSKKINDTVLNSINSLTEKYNILHITGKNNKTPIKATNYYQVEFTSSIEDFFDLCDIVVCRGGANSLFELLALKKPMIIIPLSKAQSRGDQIENAQYFEDKKYAKIIMEEKINKENLICTLDSVLKNKEKFIKNMSNANALRSNDRIVEIINNLSNK